MFNAGHCWADAVRTGNAGARPITRIAAEKNRVLTPNLRKEIEEEIEENLLPFGVVDTGGDDMRDVADALEFSKMKDEIWTLA